MLKEYKKSNLSNKSSNEEALKKLREANLDNSAYLDVSVYNEDHFTEGLKSPQCVSNLINCMKNLKSRLVRLSKCSKKTKDRQIKGKCQRTDLAKSLNFINQRFDEYEKD